MLGEDSVTLSVDDMTELSVKSSATSTICSATMDYRFLWIWDRLMKFFLLDSTHKHIFDTLLNENNCYFHNKLTEFLNCELYGEMDLEKKVIYFYKTYRKEIIQEEILVWEESHAKAAIVPPHSAKGRAQRLTKSAPGKTERAEDEKTRKGKKKKGGKIDNKSDENSVTSSNIFTGVSSTNVHIDINNEPEDEGSSIQEDDEEIISEMLPNLQKTKLQSKSSTLFAPPPGEENKYVLTKKVVDKETEIPVLHIIFGQVRSNTTLVMENINYIYFLRTSEEIIPQFTTQKECDNNITNYLIIGSLNGSFLNTLNNMLIYVFKPFVEKQYRGTGAALEQIRKYEDKDLSDTIRAVESQTMEFSKISKYHRLSTTIENLNPNQLKKISESKEQNFSENSATPLKTADGTYKQKSPVESSKLKLLEYLDKLTATVGWTLKYVEGDGLLQLPKLSEITSMDLMNTDLSKLDENKIKEFEEIIIKWEKHIEKVLDSFIKKSPEGKGPMAEYNHWNNRETGLSLLVEQLNLPVVRKLLSSSVLDPSVTSAFHWYEDGLWNFYMQARNNNKFLITVLRYFQLIDESNDFDAISDIIPALMEGMRMIWVLSKYYNSEERMTALLERISWQLCENVKKNLSIKDLFSKFLYDILTETQNACKMMNNWKASYLNTREMIELTEKGARWEFNQYQLFKNTDYIAKVCNDLNKIASVLEDFYNIFGVELKSIITDPIQIDNIVKKVDELIIPIKNSDFNIFTEFNKENWDATMVWFYLEVSTLENEAKYLIDDCFTVLISAEQAIQLLLKFKNIKTRQAIQECLLIKFDVIMQQFSKEMNEVQDIFQFGKRNPPVLKYHSPVVGAIFWERQLYHRLKRSIMTFQNIQELNNSYLRSLTFTQYFKITKQMELFEESCYTTWITRAETITKNIMTRKILKTINVENTKFAEEKQTMAKIANALFSKSRSDVSSTKISSVKSISGSRSMFLGASKIHNKSAGKLMIGDNKSVKAPINTKDIREGSIPTKITWIEADDKIMVEKQLEFQINFDHSVLDVIDEAEMLELLGFELPISVRDICTQKNRLKADIDAVQTTIDQYNKIIHKLDAADVKLLIKEIKKMEKYINSGVTRVNWSSLGICDYATNCMRLLKNLDSIVTQLSQMKKKLDDTIDDSISCYNLCSTVNDPNDAEYTLTLCKAYFLDVELKRSELVNEMVGAYQSISPMLIKIENLIEGTSTGKSEAMQIFYKHYEKKIFTALITCFSRNLATLNDLLTDDTAMFLVDAILLSSEVILRPSASEINSIILNDIKNLLDKCKIIPRWLNGSCLECKSKKDGNADDLIFSFFEDVMSIQIINERIEDIHETTMKLTSESSRYINRWKRYSNLWRLDKAQICEKFADLHPTLSQYDEKFTFYDSIIEEIETIVPYYDIFSIRINLVPLINSINYHVQEWKQILGNYLIMQVQQLMKNLQSKIEKFRSEIEIVVTGLNRFKTVMQSIANIKNMAIQAEVEYSEYQETFRVLRLHGITYCEEDEAQAHKLQLDWQSIYFGALFRSNTLSSTKDCFCDMTKEQIDNFLKDCEEFLEYFEKEGPGSVGNDLEAGFLKMDECEKLIMDLEERRDDLVKAERLFDLTPTDYFVFTKIKNEFEAMQWIYALYQKQKNARDDWAKTMWIDLNPQMLIDGMDYYIKEFQELPTLAKELRVGQALKLTMENFKNSVPLFIELKNEAMRERHWTELMNMTKEQQFNVSANKFDE